jgi:RNA polymerase sigma-70 factor (ECF subfamily)
MPPARTRSSIASAQARPDYGSLDDVALARLLAARDPEAVRLVTTRNNQRLFRAAWSILKNRDEAEDAVQSAYLRAFAAITGFEGRSSLNTWLTRIVINEALGRDRAAKRRRSHLAEASVSDLDDYRDKLMRGSTGSSPEAEYARGQLRRMLEDAIAGLPAAFRPVFVLREIEGMSVEATAEALDLLPATVKTRHLRARRRLQQALAPELGAALAGSFEFAGADCEAMTRRIVASVCGS